MLVLNEKFVAAVSRLNEATINCDGAPDRASCIALTPDMAIRMHYGNSLALHVHGPIRRPVEPLSPYSKQYSV